jgi:hypothetical protein
VESMPPIRLDPPTSPPTVEATSAPTNTFAPTVTYFPTGTYAPTATLEPTTSTSTETPVVGTVRDKRVELLTDVPTVFPTFYPTDGPTSEEAEVGVGMAVPTDTPTFFPTFLPTDELLEQVVAEASLRYDAVSNSNSDASLRYDVAAMGPLHAAEAATEARKQGILNREWRTGLRASRERRHGNGRN